MGKEIDLTNDLEILLFGKEIKYKNLESKLIHLFGEAGTGKSTIAIHFLCKFAQNKKKVVFIDTEGKITGSKIKGILQDDNLKQLNGLFKFYRPTTFQEQHELIINIEPYLKNQNIGLIIIDTITNLYRQETDFLKNDKIAFKKLAYQVAHLRELSNSYQFPILIFNQATMKKMKNGDPEILFSEKINPVAKAIISYWSDKEIILLSHGFGDFEARKPGETKGKVKFTIDPHGIKIIK